MSPFRARPPWWGGDLQTIRGALRPALTAPLPWSREWIRLADGDALAMALHPGEGPLVVLIHGLAGSEESSYLRGTARFWVARGRKVARLNLRGAGVSAEHCSRQYHAGKGEDIRAALGHLAEQHGPVSVAAVSLGGTQLLNALGQGWGRGVVRAAASVCAPLDLTSTSARMMRSRNFLYHRWVLGHMHAEVRRLGQRLPGWASEAALAADTVRAFDDRYVGPFNGFEGADDYYRRCSPGLEQIVVPTLCLTAADDPWIDPGSYRNRPGNDAVTLEVAAGGGHVGFHDAAALRADAGSWADRRLAEFFQEVDR